MLKAQGRNCLIAAYVCLSELCGAFVFRNPSTGTPQTCMHTRMHTHTHTHTHANFSRTIASTTSMWNRALQVLTTKPFENSMIVWHQLCKGFNRLTTTFARVQQLLSYLERPICADLNQPKMLFLLKHNSNGLRLSHTCISVFHQCDRKISVWAKCNHMYLSNTNPTLNREKRGCYLAYRLTLIKASSLFSKEHCSSTSRPA